MTAPSPATLEREKDKLYVTDAEIIGLIAWSESVGTDRAATGGGDAAGPSKLESRIRGCTRQQAVATGRGRAARLRERIC